MNSKTDEKVAKIAAKLRKIRELKNLTREQFCERLGENVEYWGKIERGEQTISLGKLLQVCEVYHIRIEEIITLDFQEQDTQQLRDSIVALLDECDYHQLEITHKFIMILPRLCKQPVVALLSDLNDYPLDNDVYHCIGCVRAKRSRWTLTSR